MSSTTSTVEKAADKPGTYEEIIDSIGAYEY